MNMIGSLLDSGKDDKILADVDEKKQGMSFDLNSVMQSTGANKSSAPASPDPNANKSSAMGDIMKYLNF